MGFFSENLRCCTAYLAIAAASCATVLAVFTLSLNDELAAAWVMRTACVALVAVELARVVRPDRHASGAPPSRAGSHGVARVVALAVGAAVAAAFLSWAAHGDVGGRRHFVLWIAAFAVDGLLFPLAAQSMHDGSRPESCSDGIPRQVYILYAVCAATALPTGFIGNAAWDSLFLAPAALGLCLLPLLLWDLATRGRHDADGAVQAQRGGAFAFDVSCLVALVLGASLLASLDGVPITANAGQIAYGVCAAATLALVIACAARLSWPERLRITHRVEKPRQPDAQPTQDVPRAPEPARAAKATDFERGLDTVAKRLELSNREREIVAHIMHGRSRPSIGKMLGISRNTVNTHMTHVYKKAGVHSRDELAEVIAGAVEGATDAPQGGTRQ